MNSLSQLLRRYDTSQNLSHFYDELNILAAMNKNIFFELKEPIQDASSLLAIFKASHDHGLYPNDIQTPIYLYLSLAQTTQSFTAHKNAILYISRMIASIEYQEYYNYKDSHQHLNAFLDKIVHDNDERLILQALFLGARQSKQMAWFERTFLKAGGDHSLFIDNVIQMNNLATFFTEHQERLQEVLKATEYNYIHAVIMENAILLQYIMQHDNDFLIEETLALQEINRALANNSLYSQYLQAYTAGNTEHLNTLCQTLDDSFADDLRTLHETLHPQSFHSNVNIMP